MKYAIAFIFTCLISQVQAQESKGQKYSHSIESVIFGDSRTIDIYLPPAYQTGPDHTFPVMYVFDAQFEPYFDMVAYTAAYLAAIGSTPEFIAVGVHTKDRPREFTTAPEDQRTIEGWGDIKIGEAHLLSIFLSEEVFPLVDSIYQTSPLRLGVGHSLGGTFVTNSMLQNEKLFLAVISISPNMMYDYRLLPARLDAALRNGNAPNAWHFMTAGGVGNMENNFRAASEYADSVYQVSPADNFKWTYRYYPDENHSTTPLRSISEGLIAFNDFWFMGEEKFLELLEDTTTSYLESLQNQFEQRSDWAGFPVSPGADEWNKLAYAAGYQERWSDALPVMEWALTLFPNDANLHDSRGEALENLGQLLEAEASYKRAFEVLEETKSQYDTETYEYYHETFSTNATRVHAILNNEE